MKIAKTYDKNITSSNDFEPCFKTIKETYNVDEIDAEEYLSKFYDSEEEIEALLEDFDYTDEDFLEWVEEQREAHYENELFDREY